jgi:O-antigen ligase
MKAFLIRKKFPGGLPLVYGAALYFFYIKYVPLIKPFQIALVPPLVLVFLLTALDIRRGTLAFIFLFPLINNLPYFFGIYEFTPHAPTALVLFLFYFFGWLVHGAFTGPGPRPSDPIFKPVLLLSGMLLASGIITFFRYANFYPFRSDGIYELTTNAFGVTAGGAIQSVILSLLLYLSGFAFFLILCQSGRGGNFLWKIIVTFCLGSSVSLSFGLIQHLSNLGLGNNLVSKGLGLLNATFKDAISFGTFLAMAIPFLVGVCLAHKGILRVFSLLLVLVSAYLILFTGSKSAFLSLIPSLIIFLFFAIKAKRVSPAILLVLLLVAAFIFYSIVLEKALPEEIAKSKTFVRLKDFGSMLTLRTGTLWKIALAMTKDFPLTGVGLGAYIIETSNYAAGMKLNIGIPESAENLLLHISAELGIIGVLLTLWMLWEIAKQIKKRYQGIPSRSPSKFIILGAAAGILAFWINAQTHTFIGSYEIHYTYWLLLGLVFAHHDSSEETSEGRAREPGQKPAISRNFKRWAALAVVLYGGFHLWNSTHSLSLKSRTEMFSLNQDFGLSQPEKTKDQREFRWTRRYGGVTVKIQKPVIVIPLLASHPDIQANPVKVKIELTDDFFKSKKLLGEIVFNQSVWKDYAFAVPEEVNKKVIVLIKVSRTWNPLKATGAPDSRDLGVALGKIEFRDDGN